jgi:selenocysteine-specific elongation factor
MAERMSEGYACFEAELFFDPRSLPGDVQLKTGEERSSASLDVIQTDSPEGPFYVQVRCASPLNVHWKSPFEVFLKGKGSQGEGRVLFPFCPRFNKKQMRRRAAFLGRAGGGIEGLIIGFAEEGGFSGVAGEDIRLFVPSEADGLLEICSAMEAEGLIKILHFSPLHLFSSGNFLFLCEKILSRLEKYHEKYPLDLGITGQELGKKLAVHPRALSLALGHLERRKQIRTWDNRVSLRSFSVRLSPEEEKILSTLEAITIQGRFQSVDMAALRQKFRLSENRLNRMLDLLVERKKIVQGADGFILHAQWLEKLIDDLRRSGDRELTVSRFKEMTGLTRKYAIPLLELLDQMHVTRRRGSVREIL